MAGFFPVSPTYKKITFPVPSALRYVETIPLHGRGINHYPVTHLPDTPSPAKGIKKKNRPRIALLGDCSLPSGLPETVTRCFDYIAHATGRTPMLCSHSDCFSIFFQITFGVHNLFGFGKDQFFYFQRQCRCFHAFGGNIKIICANL